ncbi:MAG: GNAT family N-acetyltransferase [Oscillospiraceae bacterium]|nr:GNAT family N-acetyltransferase [Oscillospiraceae bacterium]
MKNAENEIISAISIDSDEEVEALECWSSDLQPSGELSRLCVRKDMQNQGIARQMMRYSFDILRSEGKKSVHILVRKGHNIALKSYMPLGFSEVGECNLFEKDFICLEMNL